MAASRGQPRLPGFAGDARTARVRRAVDAQIVAQRKMGQIETVDAGLIAVARTLADALDSEWLDPDGSRFTVGTLAARLVPVLLELRGERYDRDAGGADEELAALVAALRDAPRPDA